MLSAVAKALRSGVRLEPGPKEVFEMVTGHSQFRDVILPGDWKKKTARQRKGEQGAGRLEYLNFLS